LKIFITGTERDIANSAWISTMDERKTQTRTDADVYRVVKFLVENHHTSPLECVTISLLFESTQDMSLYRYFTSAYTEDNTNFYSFAKAEYLSESSASLTIDLLNFLKVVKHFNLFETELWDVFANERPVLAELLLLFPKLEPQPTVDASAILGNSHGMTVDLVNVHSSFFVDSNAHKRATWRVKCPLSIAVQILRHRAGSFNMVSGRYRTITQEMISLPDDIASLFDRISEKEEIDHSKSMSMNHVLNEYADTMAHLKKCKEKEVITNDEYKRLREFVRLVLPEGRLTELYITFYLDSFYDNYVNLRNSKHAQTEHIWVVQEMQRVLEARTS
jgi:thymidylate synthase ThyX